MAKSLLFIFFVLTLPIVFNIDASIETSTGKTLHTQNEPESLPKSNKIKQIPLKAEICNNNTPTININAYNQAQLAKNTIQKSIVHLANYKTTPSKTESVAKTHTTTPKTELAAKTRVANKPVKTSKKAIKPDSLHYQKASTSLLTSVSSFFSSPEESSVAEKKSYVYYEPSISSRGYQGIVADLKGQLQNLSTGYTQAQTHEEREYVLNTSKKFFAQCFETLIEKWYGTPWDFYGDSKFPHTGYIACGYLVSNTLNHLSVDVDRRLLAQQWPVNMVRSMFGEEMSQVSDRSAMISIIQKQGYGVYMIGLDRHVGFILYDSYGMKFIHSSYSGSKAVLAEEPEYSLALLQSGKYYIGKLTSDSFMRKWLTHKNFYVIRG